jgi:hypothetical protein
LSTAIPPTKHKRIQTTFPPNMEKMMKESERIEERDRSEILRDAFLEYYQRMQPVYERLMKYT